MKKYIYLVSVLMIVAFAACDDKRNYDEPKLSVPKYESLSTVISIADLKTLTEPMIKASTASETNNNFGYLQNPARANEFLSEFEHEAKVRKIATFSEVGIVGKCLKATVVGNDESGNIYKQLYLQDETGAILVIVNLTGVFAQFTVGQQVIVELDNLSMGKYYGAYQIGAPVVSRSISYNKDKCGENTTVKGINYGMSRLTPRYFEKNIYRNDAPDTLKVQSLCKTYTKIPVSTENVRNTLVRLENVSFVESYVGSQFAPLLCGYNPATGTVKLNVGGSQIDVRTSGYANFAGDTVPAGTGTVTAILSQYFENLQITIRKRSDLQFNN